MISGSRDDPAESESRFVDEVVKLLADLVSIPSVNPMGEDVSGSEYLETATTAYLERWFSDRGIETVRDRIAPGRDNLIVRFDSTGSRTTILFDAHQDTVPVNGMTIDPFTPRIEQGVMYGRGSCDVKGGLAAMAVAVARLHRERPSGAASVVVACTVDEEFTHLGSSRLAENKGFFDLAIVAEPTRLNIVHSHKGAIRWKIHAHGVACHSSTPRLGSNAIYLMAKVVAALSDHADSIERTIVDPILGPATLSVGRIEGGRSVNVVPDRCSIEIDRRAIPGENPDRCVELARSAIREALTAEEFQALSFDPPWISLPPLAPVGTDRAAAILTKTVERVTGRTPSVEGAPYGTDAGPLSAAGTPCLVFGPGDIARAHTKNESIELDQVRAASEIYYQFICESNRLVDRLID